MRIVHFKYLTRKHMNYSKSAESAKENAKQLELLKEMNKWKWNMTVIRVVLLFFFLLVDGYNKPFAFTIVHSWRRE